MHKTCTATQLKDVLSGNVMLFCVGKTKQNQTAWCGLLTPCSLARMPRFELTDSGSDHLARNKAERHLARALRPYEGFLPTAGLGLLMTLTTVYTTTKQGVRGFLSSGSSGDDEAAFLKKIRVSYDVMEAALIKATGQANNRKLPMNTFYEHLARFGTGTQFQANFVSFTNYVVSCLVSDDTLKPLFGPTSPRITTKEMPTVGHVVMVSTTAWFQQDAVTKAVMEHPSQELKFYSTVAIAHPKDKDDTFGCVNMGNVAKLLVGLTADFSFNLIHEYGVPHKVGNGTQPQVSFLAFDASMRKVSYEQEEQDRHNDLTAELDASENVIDKKKMKTLQEKVKTSVAALKKHNKTSAAKKKKKRQTLADKTNGKSQADSEDDAVAPDAHEAVNPASAPAESANAGVGSSVGQPRAKKKKKILKKKPNVGQNKASEHLKILRNKPSVGKSKASNLR